MKSNAGSKKCGGQFPRTRRDCKKEKDGAWRGGGGGCAISSTRRESKVSALKISFFGEILSGLHAEIFFSCPILACWGIRNHLIIIWLRKFQGLGRPEKYFQIRACQILAHPYFRRPALRPECLNTPARLQGSILSGAAPDKRLLRRIRRRSDMHSKQDANPEPRRITCRPSTSSFAKGALLRL